jgi:uncharacterized RDD family membrane protein YckC
VEYEDRVTIATPEGVDLELALAGLGSRAAARAIDLVLLAALIGALAAVFVATGRLGAGSGQGLAIALFVAASFLVVFGYDVLFESLGSGRTPGKRAVGLRVVRAGGQPVGFRSSAVRNVLRLIEGLPLSWAPGIVAIVATGRNQRIGDLAADTIVLRDRVGPPPWRSQQPAGSSVGWRSEVPEAGGGAVAGGTSPAWDVSAITSGELAAVRQFLARRSTLTTAARTEIAAELEARLRARVAGAPAGIGAEPFLEQLAGEKEARGR